MMHTSCNRQSHFDLGSVPRSRRTIVSLLRHVRSLSAGLMFADFDMTWANSLRKQMKRDGKNVTITAILIKAIAVAQKLHPESRTEWLPFGRQVTYNTIVAGFTVERFINGQATVLLGEIDNPIEKPLELISQQLKEHAEKPIEEVAPLYQQNLFSFLPAFLRGLILEMGKRNPFLRLQCQHATFGLTSLGKLGTTSLSCPCLCACSFSVGIAEERAVVQDGVIVARPMMTVGLNYDQRAIDLPSAARVLNTVKSLMEGGLEEWLPESLLKVPSQERLRKRQLQEASAMR